jgi:hypothetical protein
VRTSWSQVENLEWGVLGLTGAARGPCERQFDGIVLASESPQEELTMAILVVALACFTLALFCMSLLAAAKMGDQQLELVERSHRERSRVRELTRADPQIKEALIEEAC